MIKDIVKKLMDKYYPVERLEVDGLLDSKLKYETNGPWIRFPTLPQSRYNPNTNWFDIEQQLRIANAVASACKKALKK